MGEKDLISDFIMGEYTDMGCKPAAEVAAKCAWELCLSENLDRSALCVLEQLCDVLSARRAYLYQLCEREWKLIHEWQPKTDHAPQENAALCFDGLALEWKGDEPLLLKNLEPLREICPAFYALLAARGTVGAAVMPLKFGESVKYCLGVDDPQEDALCGAGFLLRTVGAALIAAQRLRDNEWNLDRLRTYDGLTGAFQRDVYLQKLQEVHLDGKSIGIIRFRIVDLKRINERYGYTFGDNLLVKCIRHVAAAVAVCGKVYRINSDEFAVICTGLERSYFENLAIQLSPDLEESVHCAIAVGYQWTARPRILQRLNLAAEAMMEESKRSYARLQALTEQRQMIGEDVYGMLTIDGITTLLEAGRFIVYLQPKLSFQSGELVGAEALVRFLDSDGTIVDPGRFLPDLETAKLMKYVDLFVFEHACCLIRSWLNEKPYKYTSISINFSKLTLEEPNLVSQLLHLCRKHDIEPEFLEVEIAGNLEKQQSDSLSRIVDKIRAAGFVVSVDNFGIRFASLSLLIALDCDKLKVDRSLVENITTSPKARTILKALAALSAATGIKTTVEGIETNEQLSMLKNMGFNEMQGYLISQPLTVEMFREKYFASQTE